MQARLVYGAGTTCLLLLHRRMRRMAHLRLTFKMPCKLRLGELSHLVLMGMQCAGYSSCPSPASWLSSLWQWLGLSGALQQQEMLTTSFRSSFRRRHSLRTSTREQKFANAFARNVFRSLRCHLCRTVAAYPGGDQALCMTMFNYTIPAADTSYTCRAFSFPPG